MAIIQNLNNGVIWQSKFGTF